MYKFLSEGMLPNHLQPLGQRGHAGIPDKVRPLRKFAMSVGIKRPYLYNKAALTQLVKETLKNGPSVM